jgi:peptide/nickel transport system substrate-binding protein
MLDRQATFLQLMQQFQRGGMSRRTLLRRASALGVTAPVVAALSRVSPAGAQDSTPEAAGTPDVSAIVGESITREEYEEMLREEYPIPEDAQEGGTIILGDITDITTTNTLLADNSPTLDVMGLVHESLWTVNVLDPEYVPALANSWELAEDGLTYTFHLNPDVTWHDGEPFTADDVIMSMEAQSSPDTGSSYTASFNDTVASYEKIDDHTVQVVATDVFPQLLFFGSAYFPVMPAHIWGDVPFADWATDPGSTGEDPSRVVGTGPFVFQEWNLGETVRLTRNENYWYHPPFIEEFVFQVWPDQSSSLEALRSGEIDIVDGVPNADAEDIADAENTDLAVYPTYSFNFYAYNLDPEKTTLFQDVEVRQALFYALDRETLIEEVYYGYGEVAHGTQPLLSPAYAPDEIETIYNYDPEKARQLLEEAGWTDEDGDGVREKGDQRLSFELMYTGGVALYNQLVPYMQEAWAEIGVEMVPNAVDFGSVLIPAITENFDYQVALLGFSWDITGDQAPMFATDQYIQGFNMMRYSNPEVDALYREANRTVDPERRRELLIEASNIVNNDLPVGIVVFSEARVGYTTRMQNYHPNAYGDFLWNIDTVWLQQS